MDILSFAGELISSLARHGWSVTTLVVALTALLRVNAVRKMLLKRLPKRFRTEDRLEHIAADVRAIKAHLGVVECHADLKVGSDELSRTNGAQKKLSSLPAAYAHAIITRYFTRLKETYPSQQRRMNMKSKLLSRKFLMALISAGLIIANDGLGLGLDQNTIIAFGSIMVSWIIGEAAVDAKRAGGTNAGTPTDTEHSV